MDSLPVTLRNDFSQRGLSLALDDDAQRIASLKDASSSIAKKIENEVIQLKMSELKSLLNLSYLTLFYNDFLDPTVETTYQEKIDPDLFATERPKLEHETRAMVAEENLLAPRSVDYQILTKLGAACRDLFGSDTRAIKRFISSFVQMLISETRWHLKNYELLKTRPVQILSFYEFEFLLNMTCFPEQFLNDEGYGKIRGVFANLANESVDRQKLFSFYKLKLKTMHIRYHYVFNFRQIAATAE
jgi:hypothetical protein